MDPDGHTGTAQAPPRARIRDRSFFVAAAAIVAVAAGRGVFLAAIHSHKTGVLCAPRGDESIENLFSAVALD